MRWTGKIICPVIRPTRHADVKLRGKRCQRLGEIQSVADDLRRGKKMTVTVSLKGYYRARPLRSVPSRRSRNSNSQCGSLRPSIRFAQRGSEWRESKAGNRMQAMARRLVRRRPSRGRRTLYCDRRLGRRPGQWWRAASGKRDRALA